MQDKSNEKKSLVVSLTNKNGGYDTLNTITSVSNEASLFKLNKLNKVPNTNNNYNSSFKNSVKDDTDEGM
jgi:hypothetical protein